MKRILIIGSPGVGKTTFAKQLAKEKDIPLFHMDDLYWTPGWVERDYDLFKERLHNVLKQDEWILDGNYLSTMPERFDSADTVYHLKASPLICTYRVIKRWARKEGFQAEGCPQKVDFEFLKYVFWTFPREHISRIANLKAQYISKLKWIEVKHNKVLEEG